MNRRGLHHINYLVEDIPTAVDRWVEVLGAGPFYWLGEHIDFDELTFRGEPCVLDHGAVIARSGDTFIELSHVYDISPAPLERAFMGASASPNRVGHTSYMVPDARAEGERLKQLGMPEFFVGRKGPVTVRFHDAETVFGHPIELHQLGGVVEATFEVVTAGTKDWDGSDPLRHLPPPPAE